MNQSLKIVFFGNEHLATGVESSPMLFQALLESPHQIVALVVHSSEQHGRSQKKEAIIALAEAQGIPVYNPSKAIECVDLLRDYGADCAVLAAYGKMVPREVIEMFPHGIINLHPSLLPKLRGSTPIETAILEGSEETGVSIMKLAEQMDAGPIYSQIKVAVECGISKQQLVNLLHVQGAQELVSVLGNLDEAEAKLVTQNEAEATFCTLIKKSDGQINWAEPAEVIERKIRAYAGWPKSFTVWNNARYIISQATVIHSDNDSEPGDLFIDATSKTLRVATGDGLLQIESIQPEGKKEMPVSAFLIGYSEKIV